MVIIPAIVVALGVYLLYRMYINFKDRNPIMAIIQLCLGAFLIFFGSVGVSVAQEPNSTSQSADTTSSSSKTSSSSEDDSSDEKESDKVSKARVKNTCDALNEEMSKHSELDGFSMKPDGDQFKVTVPNTATALSDNEQKSLYKSIVDLIYSYDNGTNEGAYVEFDGNDGMPVAHYSYISGKIKLDE